MNGINYNFTTIGYIDNFNAGFLTKIKLNLRDGDFKRADYEINLAESFSKKYNFIRLELMILLQRVHILCDQGQGKKALQLCLDPKWEVFKKNLKARTGVSSKNEIYNMAYFRAMSANGRGSEVLSTLKNWVKYISHRHCHRSYLRLSVLLAKILIQQNEVHLAQRYLIEALQVASVEGYFSVFIDEGSIIAKQIQFLRDQTDPLQHDLVGFLNKLIAAYEELGILDNTKGSALNCEIEFMFEELNTREREILGLSKDSVPNKDIAAQLGLSESTVKWYWQKIYTKLDVNKRSDAIKRARFIGVLQ